MEKARIKITYLEGSGGRFITRDEAGNLQEPEEEIHVLQEGERFILSGRGKFDSIELEVSRVGKNEIDLVNASRFGTRVVSAREGEESSPVNKVTIAEGEEIKLKLAGTVFDTSLNWQVKLEEIEA